MRRDLRGSLDTLRLETEKQSSFHAKLAAQIKDDLEGGANLFLSKQTQHKRQVQAPIEKEFKTKQQQEAHVIRARDKYEGDCVKINSYTAQQALMQGKDLEKIQQKLRNAQQTVASNERDFAQFSRELQETTAKWEVRWKDFCDKCQDLEEERLEFMKDHMWGYANAISTVCVADDESCERMRLSLEQMEPEKDMESFVRNYGTGDGIPDPPAFVNYTDPNAVPSQVQRPTTRPARFERATRRVRQMIPPAPDVQEEDNGPMENTAGVGAGGGRAGDAPMSRSRSASRASVRNQPPAPDRSAAPPVPPQSAVVTNGHGPSPVNGSTSPVKVGQADDPLARQLAELQKGIDPRRSPATVGAGPGAPPRQPSPAPSQGQGQRQPVQTHQPKDSVSQLAPPPGSRGGGPPDRNPDYRRSAELVVGSFPPNVASSRPTSPSQPMPVMAMRRSSSIPDNTMVQNVLNDYQQSFPGERKSVSRPGSRAGSISGPVPGQAIQQAQIRGRPESMAGVGAQGRSPSPHFIPRSRDASPMQPKSVSPSAQQWSSAAPRAPSPYQSPPQAVPAPPAPISPAAQVQAQAQNRAMRNPPPGAVATAINNVHPARQNSMSVPQSQPVRAASPNPVGIALDPSGRVAIDDMAEKYLQRQRSVQTPYRGPVQQGPPVQQLPPQRQPSYPPPAQVPPQPPQPMYAQPPPPPAAPGYGYQQPPQQIPPASQPPQQMYGQAPQYGQYPYNGANGQQVQRVNTGYYNPPQSQQPYRAVSPAPPPAQPQRSAQAPPAGYTDDGRPILFYVKALYDYDAVIDEEFDFQSGDIIAVTATPEDGWWSGELLDEQRRQPGRHVFPSNFVDLLQ
ncbi:hypothetical protein EIP86_000250 [Pleurotus ostreatoroseus]|nr:hypothetical protein EIP86_000250 [Pleurotus ostreatoroseus]